VQQFALVKHIERTVLFLDDFPNTTLNCIFPDGTNGPEGAPALASRLGDPAGPFLFAYAALLTGRSAI
jgi:hypothetical protein